MTDTDEITVRVLAGVCLVGLITAAVGVSLPAIIRSWLRS